MTNDDILYVGGIVAIFMLALVALILPVVADGAGDFASISVRNEQQQDR
jgi:hypothetical protein